MEEEEIKGVKGERLTGWYLGGAPEQLRTG